MAKKTAAAKKMTAKKSKHSGAPKAAKAPKAKPTKSATTQVKTTKPTKLVTVKKTVKPEIKMAKIKPALMTKKGKVSAESVDLEIHTPPKARTVTEIVESVEPALEDTAKAEKVSKIKAVRIDRGNLADEKAKWLELNKKYGKDKAISYKMSESYSSMTPLQHKILGWGFILTNENNRLEVLFETGIRVLISNYKS